jgi:DNA-binding GntR family transcriptional regulator
MVIVAKTLSDHAFEVLRERILSTELAPLTPIRQDAIAEELGISKIPLREALARLEQHGLLSSHPNRGFCVSPLSAAEGEEVFALRLKIEPEAAAAASLRADAVQRQIAANAFLEAEAALKSNSIQAVPLNRMFHLILTRNADRKLTTQLIERLHVVADRYVRKHLQIQGRTMRADREHKDILEAWLARDAANIEHLLFEHIQTTLFDLRSEL